MRNAIRRIIYMSLESQKERNSFGRSTFEKIMAKNFPKVMDSYSEIQEIPQIISRINTKEAILDYIIVKLLTIEDREKICRASRGK